MNSRDCLQLAKYFLEYSWDCWTTVTFRFSQWDPANPGNKYEGTPEQWEEAQRVMEQHSGSLGREV